MTLEASQIGDAVCCRTGISERTRIDVKGKELPYESILLRRSKSMLSAVDSLVSGRESRLPETGWTCGLMLCLVGFCWSRSCA